MEEKIKEALMSINFAQRYAKICNQYYDLDNGVSFKKEKVSHILNILESKLNYSVREKLFFKDYKFGDVNLRFVLPYKYGFIDCLYAIWKDDNSEKVRGGFGTLSSLVDPDFEVRVDHKFPIATCEYELEEILKSLMNLHEDFVSNLEGNLIKELA